MKILVVGGSGFIGQSIQQLVIDKGMEDSFIFTYNDHPERIDKDLRKVRLNLLGQHTLMPNKFPVAIYIAGNADHQLSKLNPLEDLNLNAGAFANFAKGFNGSLVLLSSQAVYYGLKGEISETVDTLCNMPYGISKQMTEAYAKYYWKTGQMKNLWIFRLMYTYGQGEKDRRLIPVCARASVTHRRVSINGGGRSFLNPLPSSFVGEILIRAAREINYKSGRYFRCNNLNHPRKIRVSDIVKYLAKVKSFRYEITKGGEEWPVEFWGNTKNLYSILRRWNMTIPEPWTHIRNHFLNLINGEPT
jgi:nucleoside-diphosphate-sugar epimerase